MVRRVEHEILDDLLPTDPLAVRSRRDLRRVNRIMGHASTIARALRSGPMPRVVHELGAGDGTLLADVARRLPRPPHPVRAVLIDRHPSVSRETLATLRDAGWETEVHAGDVFDWLERARDTADVTIANLFLHHFRDAALSQLLLAVSRTTRRFVACEPLRRPAAVAGASLLWLIGCHYVSSHDGRISVRAGFRSRELSALWPQQPEWSLKEWRSGPFSHAFVAQAHDQHV